jgi:hypothetical protein
MKITKSYLKQIIKEEVEKMEEGAVPLGSGMSTAVGDIYEPSGGIDYIRKSGFFTGYVENAVGTLKQASQSLQGGDQAQAKKKIEDALATLDTLLTAFNPSRMAPKPK